MRLLEGRNTTQEGIKGSPKAGTLSRVSCLSWGSSFSPPPARRQRRGLYKKRTRPFQSPPGLGRKEVFGVSTLFLSAIFLVLAGRSVVPNLLYFQWDLILERIQRRESLGLFFFLSLPSFSRLEAAARRRQAGSNNLPQLSLTLIGLDFSSP